jgi:hypothetical protein
MSQPELESTPVQIIVTIADASNLPMHHVNVMTLRGSSDEVFLYFGRCSASRSVRDRSIY